MRRGNDKRTDITRIVVVEIEPDVIEGIGPTLPKDDRVELLHGDFYEFVRESKMRFDNYHWDCFPGGSGFYEVCMPVVAEMINLRTNERSDAYLIFHGAPSFSDDGRTV